MKNFGPLFVGTGHTCSLIPAIMMWAYKKDEQESSYGVGIYLQFLTFQIGFTFSAPNIFYKNQAIIKDHKINVVSGYRIYSVGNTPMEAVAALGAKLEWGTLDNFKVIEGNGYDWGFRFTADTTSMKAAGMDVPGGVILTWWK